MKVFIITEGGRNIGLGHITRCISVYQAFEKRGIIPKFIVHTDDTTEDLLHDKNCQIFNWLEEKTKLFKLVANTDIAIIDSYLADISFYRNLSERVGIPVYIDDTKRLNYPKGILVNGSVYAEKLGYPKKNDIIYVLGSKYVLLRQEFRTVRHKEIRETVESVMITFGGNDSTNMTPKMLKLLKTSYPGLKKNVLVGKGFQNTRAIKREADDNTDLIWSPNAKTIKEIMLGCDIAISAGGRTVYELARTGIPTIGVAVAHNQLNNLEGWESAGFINYAGYWRDHDILKNILLCMDKIKSKTARRERSLLGRKLVSGRGSQRTVDFLLRFNRNFSK